jgi:hypothetical protein
METTIQWVARRDPLEPHFARVMIGSTIIGMIWVSDTEESKVFAVRPGRFDPVREFEKISEAVRYLSEPCLPINAITQRAA